MSGVQVPRGKRKIFYNVPCEWKNMFIYIYSGDLQLEDQTGGGREIYDYINPLSLVE